MFDLSGRRALVTGVGSPTGIGRACAAALRVCGAEVTGLDLEPRGYAGPFVECDLSGLDDSWPLPGDVDILVNAAGIADPATLLESGHDLWERISAINVRALVLLSAAAARRGARRIIHIGSVGQDPASIGWAAAGGPYAAYGASKAAIRGLVPVMAAELGPRGCTVNAIGPGAIVTAILAHVGQDRERELRTGFESAPAGRLGRASDIGPFAAVLASDEASFVTGETFMVDGGLRAARGPFGPVQRIDPGGAQLVWTMPGTTSGPMNSLDSASWTRSWDENVTSIWHALRAFAVESGRGHIAVIVPAFGNSDPGVAAARSALRSLVHAAAAELAPLGIAVNAVEEGSMAAAMLAPDGDLDSLAAALLQLPVTGLTIP